MYPEICIVEGHAVKRHAVRSLLDASELQKSVVLALQLNTSSDVTRGKHESEQCWIKDMTLNPGEGNALYYSMQRKQMLITVVADDAGAG